jgi:hypothetical protein
MSLREERRGNLVASKAFMHRRRDCHAKPLQLRGAQRRGNLVARKASMHWRRDCRATPATT